MAAPILALEGVTVSFDGFTVLDRLDFALTPGELRFVIGPNGAGKTTMIDVITGKVRPAAGRVVFDGQVDLLRRSEHELVRLGIARKFQTPAIFPSLSVRENLEVAAGFHGGLRALLRPRSWEDEARIARTLATIGLASRAGERAGGLSHGEKQWLEIGMLLIQEPRLLLLDEPVAGMTRRERDATGRLLRAIGQHRTVLVIEHDMAFVREFASRVTVLHQGRVLSEGPVEEVQRDPRVIDVYLGRGREHAEEVRAAVTAEAPPAPRRN